MRTILLGFFKVFFFRVLSGRYVALENPAQGRLSKKKLKYLYREVMQERRILIEKVDFTRYRTNGNKLMIIAGVVSLAAYRGLRHNGMTHEYTTLLVSDVVWKIYILGVKTIWFFAGLITRQSQKRLNLTLKTLCKYPFSPESNGYQYKTIQMTDHLSMDFTQCVVHQLYKLVGNEEEMDFFRKTWCQYDFALPAFLIEGGYYARDHTLSHGDNICDMKWYAKIPTQNHFPK